MTGEGLRDWFAIEHPFLDHQYVFITAARTPHTISRARTPARIRRRRKRDVVHFRRLSTPIELGDCEAKRTQPTNVILFGQHLDPPSPQHQATGQTALPTSHSLDYHTHNTYCPVRRCASRTEYSVGSSSRMLHQTLAHMTGRTHHKDQAGSERYTLPVDWRP